MTTFSSFVADEAAAVVRVAAAEIGPTADRIATDAAALVHDPDRLAARLVEALEAVTDADRLAELVTGALASLPDVPSTTANRRRQRDNQAALVELVRALSTVRLARHTAVTEYRDRTELAVARDVVVDALDDRTDAASTSAFRALQSLRATVIAHVNGQIGALPEVIRATPGVVRPSLALAYDLLDDIDRAGEIVGRNELPRPGFVPARPIEVLSE